MNTLNAKEAEANTDIETQRLKVQQQYNTAVQQAISEGAYQKAQSLLAEAQRVDDSLVAQSQAQASADSAYWSQKAAYDQEQYLRQKEQADNLAAYGDFSGYAALGYTDAKIAAMRQTWARKNPLLAYGTSTSTSTSKASPSGVGPVEDTKKIDTGSAPTASNWTANAINLGYGPLSESQLYKLYQDGKIEIRQGILGGMQYRRVS